MTQGGFPQVLLSGIDGLSGAVFSPSGKSFVVQTKDSLLLGSTETLEMNCWLKIRKGESFTGSPVWVREEYVLFAASGGEPKRDRLFASLPVGAAAGDRRGPLFTAAHGAALMSWDHSQALEPAAAHIVLVHRLANAMLAEVVLVAGPEGEVRASEILAVDARVEYCKPRAAFLAGGRLLLRLNAVLEVSGQVREAARLEDVKLQKTAQHGLWLVQDLQTPLMQPVDVLAGQPHGTYDVCSGTYGRPGTAEGFVLDRSRCSAILTARRVSTDQISYMDDLVHVKFGAQKGDQVATKVLDTSAQSGRGCKIAVALSDVSFVYHHRSPTECGDLWLANLPSSPSAEKVGRLTKTMPLSVQRLLVVPKEVTIQNQAANLNVHAFLFAPEGEAKLQPLLWIHGGPMAQYSFDYNPLLSWLASCGYFVMVPNVSGSTGNGLEFMNRVLDDGCGVNDPSDCLACAEYLKSEAAHEEQRLDLSRGVAVGGHSWGGYLAFLCMLQQKDGESVFSCGVATSGISDWFVQQRHTEVRYYDYALMGGWVYEPEVVARARKASPQTHAGELRAPILILHGDKDIDVPFQQIPPFVEALKRSTHPNAAVEYHAYPGEGHGMAGTETQADYLNRVKTFLRINLKPWDFTDNTHGDLTAY